VLGSAKVRRDVKLYVAHYLVIPAVVATTDLLGTIPRSQAEQLSSGHGLQAAPLPFDMPAVQVSMIWHRDHEWSPAVRWLRERIVHTVGVVGQREAQALR
jgi:DNA-binding transcriptional LysR family regulator